MKKIKGLIFAALAIIFILCGCAGGVVEDETKKRASTGDSWTVMIYMCGSTAEEDYGGGSKALASMPYDLPENINVVVETGGSRSWELENLSSDNIQDFVVQKNGIRLVGECEKRNMGDSGTLRRFLTWTADNYPAQHYMTIIWDHGGGPVGGVAYDSNYGFDSLSMGELKTALKDTGIKMDIIGFDAGLASNIETASAVAQYADYMVASEDVMPREGLDYKRLFKYISENPSASGADIGRHICDGVAEDAQDTEEYFVSMAVTDLSEYSRLSDAFDGAAAEMAAAAGSAAELRELRAAMTGLEYLGGNSQWEGKSNLVDLHSLAETISYRDSEDGEKLKSALNDAVVYKKTNKFRSGLSGLGVFYAADSGDNTLDKFFDICGSKSYKEFIEKTKPDSDIASREYNFEETGAWERYSGADISVSSKCGVDGEFVMGSTDIDLIQSAGIRYYGYNKKSDEYVYYYADTDITFDPEISGYRGRLRAALPMLNGTPVSMYRVSVNSEYEIYSIPVMKDGELKNIRAAKKKTGKDKGKYTFLCLWSGVGKYTGMANRNIENLEIGDTVTPVYEVYGGNHSQYVEGSSVRMGLGTPSITVKNLKDGEYIAAYTALDIYDRVYESDFISFRAAKGKLKIN